MKSVSPFARLFHRRSHRLLAASALALLALLAHPEARANIVYSGDQNIVLHRTDHRVTTPGVPGPEALGLDLTGDGLVDLDFFSYAPIPAWPNFVIFGMASIWMNSFYESDSSLLVRSHAAGDLLGAGPQWSLGSGLPLPASGQLWWTGYIGYIGSVDGYFGFKVRDAGLDYFGWIEFLQPASPYTSDLTLLGWAYENTAGKAIAAGDKGAPVLPPTPPTVPDELPLLPALVSILAVVAAVHRRGLKWGVSA